MGFDRRMLAFFFVLSLLGLPAFTLRVLCVGHACDDPVEATAEMPFCSLPVEIRTQLASGFREGRSPDVLGVTSDISIAGGHADKENDEQPRWPSVEPMSREVPLVFSGPDIPVAQLPAGTSVDDIAPTLASLMGIDRPHPEVRSGRAIPTIAPDDPAPVVVLIVWKGTGSEELLAKPRAWPELAALAEDGSSSFEAMVPSLPMDPAAVLTTIGTGGTPAQHGITGALVRNDEGRITEAWGSNAPVSVIAGLGDDLDELTGQRALIGLIAHDATDRGLIGKDWYVDTGRDDITIARARKQVIRSVQTLMGRGYGSDGTPDLLAVTLSGTVPAMDRATAEIVATVKDGTADAQVVVTATGSALPSPDLTGRQVAKQVDRIIGAEESVVTATVPGGLFLDQRVLTQEEIADDQIAKALSQVSDARGQEAFADVFPAIAVSFGRYC